MRIILIFPIIFSLEMGNLNVVWYLLLFAGVTDFLDGFYARRYNAITKEGSILDPLADKIIIIIPFIWLCKQDIVPYWSLSLITLREFIITAFRASKNDGMPALPFAKYKTLFFFMSLLLIFSPYQLPNLVNSGLIIYWIGFLFNILSLISYFPI